MECSRWLRRLGPAPPADGAPPAARVVCFPHAGGGAAAFRPLAKAVAAAAAEEGAGPYEVLAVRYPGRHDRLHEERLEDLRELAARAFGDCCRSPGGSPWSCSGTAWAR
ncbi:thioesterase domain-containing protein [Streptomyces endophytica]|uniref:Thioesterase domain-containing protein n=1 Tax=Streptomyces endophytica TaxID=2991496 RepID=A0ABY6P970_9ACTN|nr:thioesterase domain-containing protein [Streptomyces endophytica]UZJ30152.1 thioesterase domain-containing protein [Streptomyces endophytica]